MKTVLSDILINLKLSWFYLYEKEKRVIVFFIIARNSLTNFCFLCIRSGNYSWYASLCDLIQYQRGCQKNPYPRIKSATVRKQILKMDICYSWVWVFWYPHVNGAGTGIIVSVPVDTRTHGYSYPLNFNSQKYPFIYIYIYIYIYTSKKHWVFI